MEAMLGRIEVEMRDDIAGNFDEMYVLAEATLNDGTTVSTRCNGPLGKWGTPPISEEDHLVKVHDCLSLKYNEENCKKIISLASEFDKLSADQIVELMTVLAG